MTRRITRRLPAPILAALALVVGGSAALAQVAAQPVFQFGIPGSGAPFNDRPSFATDRVQTQRLRRAETLLEAGEYEAAFLRLQSILDADADSFSQPEVEQEAQDDGGEQFRSLKLEASEILAAAAPEARRQYELIYGPVAADMLRDAVRAGKSAAFDEVARRFFHTDAGFEAAYRGGRILLDQGEAATAALRFESLRRRPDRAAAIEPMLSVLTAVAWMRAGQPEQARAALDRLRQSGEQLALGGRKLNAVEFVRNLAGRSPNARSLAGSEFGRVADDWAIAGGNASRTAVTAPAAPLGEPAWSASTILGDAFGMPPRRLLEALAANIPQFESTEWGQGAAETMPAAMPLIVGNLAIVRTPANVRAYDLDSGELAWETSRLDRSFTELIGEQPPPESDAAVAADRAIEQYLLQRIWLDQTFNALSSDGRRVYALEDLGYRGPFVIDQRGEPHPLAPQDSNRLAAYDIEAGGKLAWQAGGPDAPNARNDEVLLAGAFFLGPPLPLGRWLYCLAESGGEIALVVLDAENGGKPAWRQTLIEPARALNLSGVRRFAGVSPSYDQGVIVCPTAAGAVVAFDLGRRMLLWGYRYPVKPAEQRFERHTIMVGPGNFGVVDDDTGGRADAAERWLGAAPVIADGCVLLTPRDSDELHCLDLHTGKLLWKRFRGNDLFVAAAHEGRAIVVGPAEINAYDLRTGKPAWSGPVGTPAPAGRGFVAGGRYHFATESDELFSVDLKDGRVVARSPLRGRLPGHLVAARGRVVCQSTTQVIGYANPERLLQEFGDRLRGKPDDVEALARRGQFRLHLGEDEAGLTDLRRVITLDPPPEVVASVADVLLDRLRRDFKKHESDVEPLGKVLTEPDRRREYLDAVSDGLGEAGRHDEAFAASLELAREFRVTGDGLQAVSGTWSVQPLSRLRAKLRASYQAATPEQRDLLDESVHESIAAADGPNSALSWLLDWHPATAAEWIFRKPTPGDLAAEAALRRELRLLRLTRSPDAPISARAAEALEELPGGLAAGNVEAFPSPAPWEGRELHADLVATRGTNPEAGFSMLWHEQDGAAGAAMRGWSFELDQNRLHLQARDAWGRPRWKLPVDVGGDALPVFSGSFATALGHLLVVSAGAEFLVVDALNVDAQTGTPQILWRKSVMEEFFYRGDERIRVRRFLGPNRFLLEMTDDDGRPLGDVGPVTPAAIGYQVGTRLHAADPITGAVLWERAGLPRGCDLAGDEDVTIAIPPDADEYFVFRTDDGMQLARRALPAREALVRTSGRLGVLWQQSAVASRLSVRDLASGREVWAKGYAAGAGLSALDEDEVAVLEPGGALEVLRTRDGELLLSATVPEQPRLLEFALVRTPDRYLVCTNVSDDPLVRPEPLAAVDLRTFPVHGLVAVLDRRGGRVLAKYVLKNETWTIDLTQPPALPVRVLYQYVINRADAFRWEVLQQRPVSVHMLDLRTGATVYASGADTLLIPYSLLPPQEDEPLRAVFQDETVRLTPKPSGDPGPAPAESK
jgi:outer membrane protein assembly factor BamB